MEVLLYWVNCSTIPAVVRERLVALLTEEPTEVGTQHTHIVCDTFRLYVGLYASTQLNELYEIAHTLNGTFYPKT